MAQIIKDGDVTIIKTGERVDTLNAAQFERDIEPTLIEGVNIEFDCTELVYISSSGLRVIQGTLRTVSKKLGGQVKMTHVSDQIYKVLYMTGFTRHLTVVRD